MTTNEGDLMFNLEVTSLCHGRATRVSDGERVVVVAHDETLHGCVSIFLGAALRGRRYDSVRYTVVSQNTVAVTGALVSA